MSTPKTPVLMRVNVVGYGGSPISLYCAYDPGTDILAVIKEGDYDGGPKEGFLKITSQTRDASFDATFAAENTQAAIAAFFEMDALKLLNMPGNVGKHNPRHKIEQDGMDEGGMKYRFAPDIGNGQVAVLAASHFANSQRGYGQAADFAEEMKMMTI